MGKTLGIPIDDPATLGRGTAEEEHHHDDRGDDPAPDRLRREVAVAHGKGNRGNSRTRKNTITGRNRPEVTIRRINIITVCIV